MKEIKFKVGDWVETPDGIGEVLTITGLEHGSPSYGVGIKGINGHSLLKDHWELVKERGYWNQCLFYLDEQLEKINEPKFKVGEKVKTIGGTIGKVVEIAPRKLMALSNKGLLYKISSDGLVRDTWLGEYEIKKLEGQDQEPDPEPCHLAEAVGKDEPAPKPERTPNHYKAADHDCLDEMVVLFGREAAITFCKLNVYKYRFRASEKNGAQDIKKAEHYIQILKDRFWITYDDAASEN